VAQAADSAGPGVGFVAWAGELGLLFFQTVGTLFRGRLQLREVLRQMSVIGVSSIPLTLLVTAFSGMVLSLHTANQLKRLGAEGLIGGIVAVSDAREMAPVLAAIMVAARVGSAIAAEIGTMSVTEQVDALRALGVSPVQYLVAPRFVAAVVMLPVLAMFGNAAGLLGGMGVSMASGVSGLTYLNSARHMLEGSDLVLGLAKTLVFGAIIAVVGCHQGLRTSGGAAGVGRSTTAAVVTSIVLIYIADYFLSDLMFGSSSLLFHP
jgi:phospholipid/cholesterol/gamma-HCH transport system permease protein